MNHLGNVCVLKVKFKSCQYQYILKHMGFSSLVPILNRSCMKECANICSRVILHNVLLEFYYMTVIINMY